MAKVKNPLLSTEASGTLSGLSYGKNRGLRIVRAKPARSKRYSHSLAVSRVFIGWLARSWSFMSDKQRQGWRDWSRNHPKTDNQGVLFRQTGFNAFCALNHAKFISGSGATPNLDAPVNEMLSSVASLVLTNVVPMGGFRVTITYNNLGTLTKRVEYQITRGASSGGRESVANRWESKVHLGYGVSSWTITGLRVNVWYWCRVRVVASTGEVSAWLQAKVQAK